MINDEISSDMTLEAITEATNERIQMREEDIMTPAGRKELEELKLKIKSHYFMVRSYEWLQSKRELIRMLEDEL